MTAAKLAALSAGAPMPPDREFPGEQLTREITFDVRGGSVDEDKRLVELSFSSEEPYNRGSWTEILDHGSNSVRLGRLNSGAALLMDHNTRDQVGVVERAFIKGRKGIAIVRFGKSARAREIFEDVKDGIRKLVSVGYRLRDLVLEETEDREETYRAIDWEPYEISLVAVPADPSVGVGRDGKFEKFDPRRILENKEKDMTLNRDAAGSAEPANPTSDCRAERARILDIQEMGRRLPIEPEMVAKAIEEGWSRDELATRYQASGRSSTAIPIAESPASRDEFESAKTQFSLVRAIRDMVDGGKLTGREAEVSQELCRRNGGKAPQGIFIPTSVLSERVQLVGTANIGGNLVGDTYRPDMFIEPLRNQSVIMEMGATVMTDLVGNAVIPKQENATGGQWIAEDAAAPETDLNFSQTKLTPKTVSGNISWSRQAALQALPSMETIVRRDLSAQLAIALDAAAIAGTAANNEPRGILNTSGIGSVAIGANGGAPLHSHIVDLESAVADVNADMGNLGYLTNTKVRGKLKKTEMFSGTNGNPVWASGSTPLNGYRAGVSNNVPSSLTKGTGTDLSAIIFGNWRELLIGLWGALDLIVDPYTFSTQGRVRISAFLSADISVRHAESFAAILDASTQ